MLKFHKIFLNDGNPNSFDQVIPPNDAQHKTLVKAKNTIRDHLRERIREASISKLGMDKMVSPRFRTQGSWAYRTCVQPAHQPPQEMDWDFGVYLPVSVWIDNGPPAKMAKLYFDLVEAALDELCTQHGWALIKTKNTCARVKIAPWAHIDVPLYAASETHFQEVMEKAASANFSTSLRESIALDESIDFGEMPEAFWEQMDGIYLAQRNGEWRKSDPEAVAIWFGDRVSEHGDQLRRVCRYLKAWRDYQWPNGGGPSSVALMIAVAQDFQPKFRRDDLALLHSAHSMERAFKSDIIEPVIDGGVEDFNNMMAEERATANSRAAMLVRKLTLARQLSSNLRTDALAEITGQFGPRIASDIAFIEPEDIAEIVRATPAIAVAPPIVNATEAG